FPNREREQELYGPKKRGPKPKTLLLKPSSKPAPPPLPAPTYTPTCPSNAKLQSGAAQPKLKKDIHRCHRMSRRPLPRSDPLSQSVGHSLSPFSETVRILNRKVKPREVKKGRVILNLKMIDKAGSGGSANNKRTQSTTHQSHTARQKVPSRNRVIGKSRRFGEVSYRGLQLPVSGSGFSMFGKTFNSHPMDNSGNQPAVEHKESGQKSSSKGLSSQSSSQSSKVATSDVPSALNEPPPSASSSEVSDGESHPTSVAPTKSHQPLSAHDHKSSEEASEEEELDWHPEMAAQCANVVVTDVTTNLLTVTIKEFCHPHGIPPSSSSPCYANHVAASNKTNHKPQPQ
ncbi:hypothetical protein AMEX_G22697, partial [Astyanax mexicanus]